MGFRYLLPKPGREPTECLLDNVDNVDNPPVGLYLRDEGSKRFSRINTPEDLAREFSDKGKKSLHEILLEGMPRTVFVDIDVSGENLPSSGEIREFVRLLGVAIVETMYEQFHSWYEANNHTPPTLDDVAIYDSSGVVTEGGQSTRKDSYHLILRDGTALDDAHQIWYIVDRAFRSLEGAMPVKGNVEMWRGFIDWGIYRPMCMLRLPYHAKKGSDRVKRLSKLTNHPRQKTLHEKVRAGLLWDPWGAMRVLPSLIEAVPRTRARLVDEVVPSHVSTAALELARNEGVLTGFKEREQRGALLLFDRQMPTMCSICKRVHHAENTLMLRVAKSDGDAWRVLMYCRQAKSPRYLGMVGQPRGQFTDVVARTMKLSPEDVSAESEARLLGIAQTNKQSQVYSEQYMRDLERVPLLLVRGEMGTGKTEALYRYLNQHYTVGEGQRIIFLSFRKTFSRDIHERFRAFQFQHYKDVPSSEKLCAPRVIIQVESLHRLQLGGAGIDLLILDESESVLRQMNADTGRSETRGANFAIFHYLVKKSRHVIAMDANLGELTIDAMSHLREGSPQVNLNRFHRTSDVAIRVSQSSAQVLAEAVRAIDAGKRIVFATNSLREAKTAHRIFSNHIEPDKIRMYTSETPEREKEQEFARVNEVWCDYNVLIYTPTVTAGVSFDVEWFHELFASFSDASCGVEECRQMLGRVRCLLDKRMTIALSQNSTRARLPEDLEALRRLIQQERASLHSPVAAVEVDLTGVPMRVDDSGALVYEETPYFWLWLLNLRARVRSLNGFIRRFLRQLRMTGASITVLELGDNDNNDNSDNDEYTMEDLLVERRDARLEVKSLEVASIVRAADISNERYSQLTVDGVELTPGELAEVRRKRLRKFYMWEQQINEAFVSTYNTERARRIFMNLRAIHNFEGGARNALERLRKSELEMEQRLCAQNPDALWMNTRRQYPAHKATLGLLWATGFDSPRDGTLIDYDDLLDKFEKAEPTLRKTMQTMILALAHLGIEVRGVPRRDDDRDAYVTSVVAYVNSVLSPMYGAQIRTQRRRAGLVRRFLIQSCELFGAAGQPTL